MAIDIKPGNDPNYFIINSHGVIPVTILGNGSFDVTQIDQTTFFWQTNCRCLRQQGAVMQNGGRQR